MNLLGPNAWLPEMTCETQAFIRAVYGLLLLGTLAWTLPHRRRFFLTERWGGYATHSLGTAILLNPYVQPVALAAWFASAACLMLGIVPVAAALVNAGFCYYHFLWMRWRGVLRGMGAPGFMTWWLAATVLLLELTLHYAPYLRSLAILVVQVDYAVIMLSAGVYKLTAGYARNEGMEFGLVNPMWGYQYRFWRNLPPAHTLYKTMNHLAWSVEVVAAVLMLIPATRFLGAFMIIASFVLIATQIRLCLLPYMVMLGGMLYFQPGTPGQAVVDVVGAWCRPEMLSAASFSAWSLPLAVGLVGYLVLLPVAQFGLFSNFYGRKPLPARWQAALETYTNAFGMIIWRVFSADHTNFQVRILRRHVDGSGVPLLISYYDLFRSRFNHVGESITVTSVFTTLKYYPADSQIFRERLLRYARTLPCPSGEELVFEYLSIRKHAHGFADWPVADFVVDPHEGTVTEQPRDRDVSCLRSGVSGSPLRVGARPGSYAA